MSIAPSQVALVRAAARVSGEAPGWGALAEELQKFSDGCREACLDAPIDQLQKAQGRAVGVREVVNMLLSARKEADELERRTQHQKQR